MGSTSRPPADLRSGETPSVALSFAGARQFDPAPCGLLSPDVVSDDGRRVVFSCSILGQSYPSLVAFDTDSGAVVGTYQGGEQAPSMSEDGSVMSFVVRTPTGARLRRVVLATGAIREVDLGTTGNVSMWRDPRTSRLFAAERQRTRIFDPDTLLESVSAPTEASGLWVFDPDKPRAYVLLATRDEVTSTLRWTLRVLDTDTLSTVTSTEIPGAGIFRTMSLAPVPAAPADLASTTQGSAVELSWSAGPPRAETTRYVLEVGSAPGLSDIFSGLDVGLQTAFSAANVPPGRYSVRVRAGNYLGLSAPSNEVIVQVP